MKAIVALASLLVSSPNISMAAQSFFYDSLEHDYDVIYKAPEGQPSRLGMIREIGQKYPNIDCSKDCLSKDPAISETCGLGSLSALYVLTSRQLSTKRTDKFIWRVPNASLTSEPYAYMKEMEAGIPCEESGFIKKFPTRKSISGGRPPPIERVEVCRFWQDYFRSAKNRGPGGATAAQLKHTQSLLWKAHTASLLHAYWQYLPQFSDGAHDEVPGEEYQMWMGWNRVVGSLVPFLNRNSCASDSNFLMTQLMPNCIRGTLLPGPGGKACTGENPPDLLDMLNRWGLAVVQNILATDEFGKALHSMEITVNRERFIRPEGEFPCEPR